MTSNTNNNIIDISTDDVIDNVPQENRPKIKGLEQTTVYIESLALHGAVFNGFLVWADTQRRTVPEDIWKAEALKFFSAEEVSEAKTMLWEVSNEEDIGRLINRQGTAKQVSEIEDINRTLKTLAEKEILPLFIGTSNMLMRTPVRSEVSNKSNFMTIDRNLKKLEESIKELTEKQYDLLTKNHDRLVSKTDVGQKKVEQIGTRLQKIEETVASLVDGISKTSPAIERCPTPGASNQGNVRSSNPINTKRKNHQKMPQINENWGSSIVNTTPLDDGTMSADKDIVVYGIATYVTEKGLYDHMRSRGLNVVRCLLLTTYEQARTLTFKLTIKGSDFTKSQDMSLWPAGVTVKPFREKKNNRRNADNRPNERYELAPYNNRNRQNIIEGDWLRQQQPLAYQ